MLKECTNNTGTIERSRIFDEYPKSKQLLVHLGWPAESQESRDWWEKNNEHWSEEALKRCPNCDAKEMPFQYGHNHENLRYYLCGSVFDRTKHYYNVIEICRKLGRQDCWVNANDKAFGNTGAPHKSKDR